LREIPKLTEAVVRSEIRGNPSYDLSKTGAADAARSGAQSVKGAARDASSSAKRTARKARKVPGVAQVEGQVKGALASEGDLAITGYGKLTAAEIVEKLAHLSQVDLAVIGFKIGRTPQAVRDQASRQGVSLKPTNRSPHSPRR